MNLTELRIMGARLFRQEFSRLTEPVVVISRNEIKGVWIPGKSALATETAALVKDLIKTVAPLANEPMVHNQIARTPKDAQASRDAILRRPDPGGSGHCQDEGDVKGVDDGWCHGCTAAYVVVPSGT